MIDRLTDAAMRLLESDAVATVVTVNPDGSPNATVAWIGIEGAEVVIGTITDQRKLHNLRRDPRIVLVVQGERINEWGLREYIVIEGTARITDGGGAELLQRLAWTYLGPNVVFPRPPSPPGWVTRVTIDRVKGVGDWLREP